MKRKFGIVFQRLFQRIDIIGVVIAAVVISNDCESRKKKDNTKESVSKEPVKSNTINCIARWEK